MRRFLSGLITDTIRALTSKITFQVGGKDVIDVENDIVHFKYGGNTDNPVMIGTDLYDDVVTDNTIKVGQLNFPVYSSDTYPAGFWGIGSIANNIENVVGIGGGIGSSRAANKIYFYAAQTLNESANSPGLRLSIQWDEVRCYTNMILDNNPSAANHAVRKDYVDAHTSNASIHAPINDSGSTTSVVWSAAKIISELSNYTQVGHNHNDLYYTKSQINATEANIWFEINLGQVKVDSDDDDKDYLINKVTGGNGISVSKDATGADNTLLISSVVFMSQFNHVSGTRTLPAFIDSEKSNKILSVETAVVTYAEVNLGDNDWVQYDNSNNSDSGYVVPFDCTIVGYSGNCENGGGKTLRLYKNNTAIDNSFIVIPSGNDQDFSNQSVNVDFNAGEKIKLRATTAGGTIQDTSIDLMIKWRSTS